MYWRDEQGFSHTADAVVLAGVGEELKILLIRRKNAPYQGAFAFPGGFVDQGEDPYHACLRELKEETCLHLEHGIVTALSVRSIKGRDPRGQTKTFPFLFHLKTTQPIQAADDALSAQWVKLTEVEHLAFDHGAILCEALGALWQGMPTCKMDISLPYMYSAKNITPPYLFYGGSFMPWHAGHLECVTQASKFDGRAIIIVPDHNPFKELTIGECFWQKYVSLARKFATNRHAIFPGFFGQEVKNPTAHWIGKLDNPSFIIGDDNLFCIEHWIDYEQLLSHLQSLYIVPRNHPIDDTQQIIFRLQQKFKNCQFVLLEQHAFQDLSSTKLREV